MPKTTTPTNAERTRDWRIRKRAEGYVFRKGRAVWQPEGPKVKEGPRPHGTTARYQQRCRCKQCRAANAAYQRDRRARLRAHD